MLGHVILEMRAEVHLEKVSHVRNMVASASAHLGQPGKDLVKSVHPDHVVDVGKFLKVFAQCVHRLGEVSRLLFDLLRRLDDLLVEDLIAVGKVGHASAEDHRVLVHVDADAASFGHELGDRLAVLLLLEDFV